MEKWILTKELFDSDELKAQNEIPYLKGELKNNTYVPMGIEKMNLNHLLLKCPFLGICLNKKDDSHYATYEEDIYLFVFKNDSWRLHIAFDLKSKDIVDYAVCLYQLPINIKDPQSELFHSDKKSILEVIDFMNGEVVEILNDFEFFEVVDYGKNYLISQSN